MFPKEEVFYFDGCVRNVVTCLSKKPLEEIVYTESSKQVFLGRFLRSESLDWSNGESVTNGFALFECGCIRFPDYGSVKIYRGMDVSRDINQYLSLYDVY
jgi:hypothetical protein